MWKLAILAIGALTLSLTSSASGQCFTNRDDDGHAVAADALDRLVNGSTEFALDLFASVHRNRTSPDANVVLSPISIWSALTITWHGARGRTKQEMEQVLKYGDGNQKRVNRLFHNLTNSLQHRGHHILKVVNKLYLNEDLQLRECILDYLESETEELPLASNPEESRDVINQWVENQTDGLIDDLIPERYIDQYTRMVLVNAVYLKGTWETLFDRRMTESKEFFVEPNRAIMVDTMSQMGRFYKTASSSALRCSAIELPLQGDDVRMIVLLPDEGATVDDVVSRLGTSALKSVLDALAPKLVDLQLPKFSVEDSLDLEDNLKELGIRDLFSFRNADLSGFAADRIFAEFVRHDARIDVTEEGIEAAAAFAMGFSFLSIPSEFYVNRPFVFLIQHKNLNAILFLGTIRNPSQA